MVNLAVNGRYGAAGGLASAIAGEDSLALCRGEDPVFPPLIQYFMVLIPNLAHNFTVTAQDFCVLRVERSDIQNFRNICRRGRCTTAQRMLRVKTYRGVGVIRVGAFDDCGQDRGRSISSSARLGESSDAERA